MQKNSRYQRDIHVEIQKVPPPAASASDPSHSQAFAANCGRSSPAWHASSPDHSTENRKHEEFALTKSKILIQQCVNAYSVGEALGFEFLVFEGLLQGQDLRFVLLNCLFHSLARLRAALLCTKPRAYRRPVYTSFKCTLFQYSYNVFTAF